MAPIVVLLVDDEKMVLDALRHQIQTAFGERLMCETAEDAAEAWEVLEELVDDETQVILVVSDWLMPRVRGDVFLERVRSAFPKITRVMLTGQADESIISRVRTEGIADRLLFKPWRAEDLHEAVAAAMS